MGRDAQYRAQKWWNGAECLGYITPAGGFVIHRRIDGKLWERSTGVSDPVAALQQWEVFKQDPAAYKPMSTVVLRQLPPVEAVPRASGPPPLYLTPELIHEHLDWAGRVGKIRTLQWRTQKQRYLKWWMSTLYGVNLRTLPEGLAPHPPPSPEGCDLGLHIIHPMDVRRVTQQNRAKLIAGIKSFFGWLRTEKFLLRPHEDPTFGRLKCMNTNRAQEFGVATKLNSIADTKAVMAFWEMQPAEAWRASVLGMLLATPWHFNEVVRFADPKEAKSRLIVPGDALWRDAWKETDPDTAAVVTAQGKRTSVARCKITAEGLVHAKRLREHGAFVYSEFRHRLARACEVLGLPRIYPGRFRHTILTAATDDGVDFETISKSAQHASLQMTEVYTETAVPKKIPTPI